MNDPLPEIDPELCSGCGCCVSLCPTNALDLVHAKAVLSRPSSCTYCTVCEDICPEDAIALPFLIEFAPSGREEFVQ